MQAFSTSFDTGMSSRILFTVPQVYRPPAGAPGFPPRNLRASVFGSRVTVCGRHAQGGGG